MSDGIPKDAREVYCNERGEPIAFCPVDGIGIVDLHRAQFYQANEQRLGELAKRAAEKSVETGERQAVICIDVDDRQWTPLVDMLMPGHGWEQYRERGESPVARGVVPHALCVDLVEQFYPAAGEAPRGVGIFVFAAGGIGIFKAGR